MNSTSEGIVLHSASDLIGAIKAMLMQMDRKQRKGFLQWVKERRNEYDLTFPQGYKPPKESINVETTVSQPGNLSPSSESAPVLLVQQPGIVNPQGEIVSSEDRSTGASD